jgi:hypothetical protein
MNKARNLFAGIAIAAVGIGLVASSVTPAQAADRPLNVRIFTPDGKQRLEVKRKLSFAVGCTKNCAVVVDMKLVMPGDVIKGRVKGGIKAFTVKAPYIVLNRPALRYLKLTYPRSRFSIKVTATDISNGKKTVKRRVFRFRA